MLLHVRNLTAERRMHGGAARSAVRNLSLDVPVGGALGVLGGSGSGKSLAAAAIAQLLPDGAAIKNGAILFRTAAGDMIDLSRLRPNSRQMRRLRGAKIAVLPQPGTGALSPFHRIGRQVSEVLLQQRVARQKARRIVIEELDRLGVSKPGRCFNALPADVDGVTQRLAQVAMAVVCKPALLIADEPLLGLPGIAGAQALTRMRALRDEEGTALVVLSQDVRVLAELTDDLLVMYRGEEIEHGAVQRVLSQPLHPHAQALVACARPPKAQASANVSIETERPAALGAAATGCALCPRCPDAIAGRCDVNRPPRFALTTGRRVRCFRYEGKAAVDVDHAPGAPDNESTAWVNVPGLQSDDQ